MNEHTSTSTRVEVLDGMRGIAALLVMAMHFSSSSTLGRFFSNTYLAVDIFFVLSGFIISYVYMPKLNAGMSGKEFMARRIARLFPLSAVGAILGFFALWSLTAHGLSGFSMSEVTIASLKNFLFLPHLNWNYIGHPEENVIGLVFPGNAALWSIFFELVASFCFLGLVRLRTIHLALGFAISAVLLVALPPILYPPGLYHGLDVSTGWNTFNFLAGFPRVLTGFIAGMLVHRVLLTNTASAWAVHRSWMRNAVFPLLLVIFVLTCPWMSGGVFGLLVVTVLAPIAVAWGAIAKVNHPIARRLLSALGWMSYPIYCMQIPILHLLNMANRDFALTAKTHMPFELIVAFTTVIVACAVASVFELGRVQQRLTHGLMTLLAVTPLQKQQAAI